MIFQIYSQITYIIIMSLVKISVLKFMTSHRKTVYDCQKIVATSFLYQQYIL